MLPFALIFEKAGIENKNSNVFLILIQMLRITAIDKLTWIFKIDLFKKKYALGNIIIIVYLFIILNHLYACFFIVIGVQHSDFNTSWFSKLPTP